MSEKFPEVGETAAIQAAPVTTHEDRRSAIVQFVATPEGTSGKITSISNPNEAGGFTVSIHGESAKVAFLATGFSRDVNGVVHFTGPNQGQPIYL